MNNKRPILSHWTALPVFRFGSDVYRLREGHIEFKASGGRKWTELIYPDVQQHLLLDTTVGRWLAQLYTTAKFAEVLAD